MKTGYTKVKDLSDGLCVLDHPEYGSQLWSIVKIRGNKKCVYFNTDLKGKEAWAPITNGNNRMDRISTEAMGKLWKK